MKIIKEEQIKAVISVLEKYNVGVLEYGAIMKMFNELPEKEENKEAETLDK